MPSLAAHFTDRNRHLLEALSHEAGATLIPRNCETGEAEHLLEESETDVALVSPLFFGRRESDLALLGGACVAAVGATGEWLLHFHRGLRDIRTVGYFGLPGMETMLAEILLREKYGMSPRMQRLPEPSASRPAGMLFDSVDALLTRGAGERSELVTTSHIDLIDEWFDMTLLPLVHEVFIGWETRVDSGLDAAIRVAGAAADDAAVREIDAKLAGRGSDSETEALPAHFRYRFTEDVLEGMQVFFQLAFAYGLHRDIPDLVFWEAEQ